MFSTEYTLASRYETWENYGKLRPRPKISRQGQSWFRRQETQRDSFVQHRLVERKNTFKLHVFASIRCTHITSPPQKRPSTLTTHPTFTKVQKSIHYRSYQRLWSFPGKSVKARPPTATTAATAATATATSIKNIKNMPSSHVIST